MGLVVAGWYGSFYAAPFSLLTLPQLLIAPLGIGLSGAIVTALIFAIFYGRD